jgi:hypothetical protein
MRSAAPVSRKGEKVVTIALYSVRLLACTRRSLVIAPFPQARTEDELSLDVGDMLTLLTVNTGKPGMWRGVHSSGAVGLFPERHARFIVTSIIIKSQFVD